jgi:hypothetical protein
MSAVTDSDIVPGALVFLHLVFVSRIAVSGLLPNTYLLDGFAQPSFDRRFEEFSTYIRPKDGLDLNGGAYTTEDGGKLILRYHSGDIDITRVIDAITDSMAFESDS